MNLRPPTHFARSRSTRGSARDLTRQEVRAMVGYAPSRRPAPREPELRPWLAARMAALTVIATLGFGAWSTLVAVLWV